ncbi:MAG: hypothetical protein JWO26_1557 [Rhodospirillales bacterium]|jgi:hypothetical protein|nr:hypothetical protein [Rhodospirillales bacterium]
MASIGIPLTYRRLPEHEGETPWMEDEQAAPAILVIVGVALALLLTAAAAFVA